MSATIYRNHIIRDLHMVQRAARTVVFGLSQTGPRSGSHRALKPGEHDVRSQVSCLSSVE